MNFLCLCTLAQFVPHAIQNNPSHRRAGEKLEIYSPCSLSHSLPLKIRLNQDLKEKSCVPHQVALVGSNLCSLEEGLECHLQNVYDLVIDMTFKMIRSFECKTLSTASSLCKALGQERTQWFKDKCRHWVLSSGSWEFPLKPIV